MSDKQEKRKQKLISSIENKLSEFKYKKGFQTYYKSFKTINELVNSISN